MPEPLDPRLARLAQRGHDPTLTTPAVVFDPEMLREEARRVLHGAQLLEARALFSLKSLAILEVVRILGEGLAGFSAASLNEARLAREVLRPGQVVHLTSPGLRPDELSRLGGLVDYVGFNSLGQRHRARALGPSGVRAGLRVNPGLHLVSDRRYDPCCPKLGVPLEVLTEAAASTPSELHGIEGLHVHANCDSDDLAPLERTVTRLLEGLGPLWEQIRWVNLGGGYLFQDPHHADALVRAGERLRARGVEEVFLEPGASLVRRPLVFVAGVVDRFRRGGEELAVLDTSLDHMPEVFEYGFAPEVAGHREDGGAQVTLVGGTCLAGDVFGRYAFDAPLEVGDRVVFLEMGAYSFSRANMFNGLDLPTVYALEASGRLREVRRYGPEDFLSIWGAHARARA